MRYLLILIVCNVRLINDLLVDRIQFVYITNERNVSAHLYT